MAQSIKNKNYKTPLGTIARYTGIIITALALLAVIAAGTTDWVSLSYKTPILGVLFLGLAIWTLAQALDLYEGQWSKDLSLLLHVTTATISLAALCYVCSIFGVDRDYGHLFLIIGIILRFILAGRMMKEVRFQAEQLNK